MDNNAALVVQATAPRAQLSRCGAYGSKPDRGHVSYNTEYQRCIDGQYTLRVLILETLFTHR